MIHLIQTLAISALGAYFAFDLYRAGRDYLRDLKGWHKRNF